MIYNFYDQKAPADSTFYLKPTSTLQTNPFNPKVIVSEMDEFWDGELTYNNLTYDQARALQNWMNKLRGPVGQFWFKDYRYSPPSVWTGTPVVDGDNQDGTLLNVRGVTPNLVLQEGHRFQLGDFMYELTETVQVDAGGLVALQFLPDLRLIPTDGQALNVTEPLCKCLLYPDQTPPQPSRAKGLMNFKFKFRESIRD